MNLRFQVVDRVVSVSHTGKVGARETLVTVSRDASDGLLYQGRDPDEEATTDLTYVFPAPESEGHVRVDVAGKWLREAERLAEDHTHEKGFGWHAFRRMWATKRKHLSTKDVAYAGGWKDTTTLERVYQQPDPETTEAVVLGGRGLRMGPDGDDAPGHQTAEGR